MRVMLLPETNGLPELTDGLTALTAWVTRLTEGDGELRRRCLTEETRRGMMALCREDIYKPEHTTGMYVCMYVCIRKFITREFLQSKQSRVHACRPY